MRLVVSSSRLAYNDYDNWNSNSNVSVHLCLIVQYKPYHLVKNKFIDKCFGIPNAFGRKSILKSKEK